MAPSSVSSSTSANTHGNGNGKPVKAPAKSAHHGFGTNMPMMSSAFDTAMWLTPA